MALPTRVWSSPSPGWPRYGCTQTRGYHYRELCLGDLGDDRMEAVRLGLIARESAEFRVRGTGVCYAVPQLAIHYIVAHDYLPPEEFRATALA